MDLLEILALRRCPERRIEGMETITRSAPSKPSKRAVSWPVPYRVRIGLVALGAPSLIAGLWAVVSPQGWFDNFPGSGPALVAAEPLHNAHLATDAGAGLLASGLVLVVGTWLADSWAVKLALVAFAAFAVPHAAYHVFNPAPGLTGAQDVLNAGFLVFVVAVTAVLFVGTHKQSLAAGDSTGRG